MTREEALRLAVGFAHHNSEAAQEPERVAERWYRWANDLGERPAGLLRHAEDVARQNLADETHDYGPLGAQMPDTASEDEPRDTLTVNGRVVGTCPSIKCDAPPSEHNEGPFTWAVSQIKAGKKVRRKGWKASLALYNGVLLRADGTVPYLFIDDLTAWDWELAE